MAITQSKTNGVKASSAVDITAMTAADKAAMMALLKSSIKDEMAAREPALNEAYAKVLEILKPIQADCEGFTPYWLIPQGVAYKIAAYLQTKATAKELGAAPHAEIVEALMEQHLDEDQIEENLTKRSGDGKKKEKDDPDYNKRPLWTFENKTGIYTLIKPFKADKN
jgi:hypothetical protein